MTATFICARCRRSGIGNERDLLDSGWRKISESCLCPDHADVPDEITKKIRITHEGATGAGSG